MIVMDQTAAVIRAAQREWAALPLRSRLRAIRGARYALAAATTDLTRCSPRLATESLTSEIIPLLAACRFLERKAEAILASRIEPAEIGRTEIEIRRDPLGVVLVIGPSNYPLFLAAVHTLQALVAGNAVVLKPGRDAWAVLRVFVHCLARGGVPAGVVRLLSEDPEEAAAAIDSGVDKVVFTGSGAVGLKVMQRLALHGTPSVMELSGYDSVFVLPGADIGLVARAIRFGTQLNGGNTCIAPKQVIAWTEMAELVRARVNLPVIEVSSEDEALARAAESGYALGASVFGKRKEAVQFARRINAGAVVVNDMIAPTADPRFAFGARGKSGFGVTRGAEGLLEMTALKAIAVRRSKWLPHLEPPHKADEALFRHYIRWSHGKSLLERMRAIAGMIRSLRSRR